MNNLHIIKRVVLAMLVALCISVIAPVAQAALTGPSTPHSGPVCGDGNESHGKG